MDFNIFKMIYMSIIGVAIISIVIVALIIINNYLKEKNKIDMIKAKNDQYNIFMQMDPEAILSTIDSFIETYRIYKRLMSFECELPITSNLERKEKFLAFHNKLPLPLGFLYCYLTRKFSNALVAWRHRNLYK